jgi:hypothetical protein
MATGTSQARAEAPETPAEKLLLEEQIRQRAHQIWLENESPAGRDLIDWQHAEKEILSEQER